MGAIAPTPGHADAVKCLEKATDSFPIWYLQERNDCCVIYRSFRFHRDEELSCFGIGWTRYVPTFSVAFHDDVFSRILNNSPISIWHCKPFLFVSCQETGYNGSLRKRKRIEECFG